MRVTNSMMRNNSMLNMQKNKVYYDKALQQYNTEKKIQRPSDDPTIAVRALKYRTTLVEIDQYKKNIDDATSWMDATETVLKDVDGRLDSMITYCTQAATGTVEAKDRADIVLQLDQYAKYIYEQDANTDYAGRYLFTGYRTDVPMLFDKAQSHETYTISENLDINNINKYQYVYGKVAVPENPNAYDATTNPGGVQTADTYANTGSKYETTHRVLVSYGDCDPTEPVTIKFKNSEGKECTLTATVKKAAEDTVYNEHLHPEDDDSVSISIDDGTGASKKVGEVYFVPETGEIVFSDTAYDYIRSGSDFNVTYQKTEFDKNDIRPEHYFTCTTLDKDSGKKVTYNNASEQDIKYQINFSQTIKVNTEGCESISTRVGRTIDDIKNMCSDLDNLELEMNRIDKMIKDTDENETDQLGKLNEAKSQLQTSIDLQKSVLVKALGSAITVCQDQKNEINVALADHGSRYNRMLMTENKIKQLELDTEQAQSDNEDIDIGDAYINFTETNLLYQATLNATSKILGQSLLDFI